MSDLCPPNTCLNFTLDDHSIFGTVIWLLNLLHKYLIDKLIHMHIHFHCGHFIHEYKANAPVFLFSQDRHSVVKRGEGESPPSTSPDDTNQIFKFSPGDGQALQVCHPASRSYVSCSLLNDRTQLFSSCLTLFLPPVPRLLLFQVLIHSWSWSIPRVEGDRGSGKLLPLKSPLLWSGGLL